MALDGVENIFGRGWTKAAGSSFGIGFNKDIHPLEKHLVEQIKINQRNGRLIYF
jgi:hypothetical protein